MENIRDISMIKIKDQYLVIGCDSSGAIGDKPGDVLKVPGQVVGRFAARVPLLEVRSVGAEVVSIINTLSVEMEPGGRKIIEGIREEAAALDIPVDRVINGSTEENMETSQTGVGVTVIGQVSQQELRLGTSHPGDLVAAIGRPCVGEEVLQYEEEIVNQSILTQLLDLDFVHEIIPVGSKGIKYETDLLAAMSGLECEYRDDIEIDLYKSAGPATVLVVSLSENCYQKIVKAFFLPISIIGNLSSRTC
ncbi:MAG: hypothetical protein ACOCQN_02675 [Halanaerobiaceae bacterium]